MEEELGVRGFLFSLHLVCFRQATFSGGEGKIPPLFGEGNVQIGIVFSSPHIKDEENSAECLLGKHFD